MGLFSKREPCAVCGGKVTGLFPWKIEDQLVCNNCHGVIDMQDDSDLTMAGFLKYKAFREQNEQLREQFVVSQKIDFGILDTKIVFDYTNFLFCMDKDLDKTIFHGNELKGFVIREDSTPLFEGDPNGLVRYPSTVPDRLLAMQPRIEQVVLQQQMQRTLERMTDRDDDRSRPSRSYINIPEPFKTFNVDLYFSHPYWDTIHCDKNGPTFSNDQPDVNVYMNEYQEDVRGMEMLAQALMRVAFPNAGERVAGAAAPAQSAAPVQSAPAPVSAVDAVAEIRKYKELMEEGVITPAEFDAKKKQLLGI